MKDSHIWIIEIIIAGLQFYAINFSEFDILETQGVIIALGITYLLPVVLAFITALIIRIRHGDAFMERLTMGKAIIVMTTILTVVCIILGFVESFLAGIASLLLFLPFWFAAIFIIWVFLLNKVMREDINFF